MKVLILFASLFFINACSPVSTNRLNKLLISTEKKFQEHAALVLYDVSKAKTIFDFNGDRYFTPASNTKIFTFFAGLNLIGDSIPALRYIESGDTLVFWGTGDPSFLYKNTFTHNRVFHFLKSSSKYLTFSNSNFNTTHLGPGWAWDDYNDYYSTERSALPIYGNIITIRKQDSMVSVSPNYFSSFYLKGKGFTKNKLVRSITDNHFLYQPSKLLGDEVHDLPYHADFNTTIALLTDTLNRQVYSSSRLIPDNARVIYSIPADSLYKVMMQQSDNFIAEQLLLICAGIISDTLQPEIAIKHMNKLYLNDMVDKPKWVDGSGLSRYNLFTPRSIVQLWIKIQELIPEERLFKLLATGGQNGTIKNWYKADKPYIFGKTGSLSNNHCLSGYLITKNGRKLIFSFMNSNYTVPVSEVRKNMQNVLNLIYERY